MGICNSNLRDGRVASKDDFSVGVDAFAVAHHEIRDVLAARAAAQSAKGKAAFDTGGTNAFTFDFEFRVAEPLAFMNGEWHRRTSTTILAETIWLMIDLLVCDGTVVLAGGSVLTSGPGRAAAYLEGANVHTNAEAKKMILGAGSTARCLTVPRSGVVPGNTGWVR